MLPLNGLDIAFEPDSNKLVLLDHGFVRAEYVESENAWFKRSPCLLAKPGSLVAVSDDTILEITEGVMPDEFHSAFERLTF